jgi:uncharacterized protein
MKPGNRQLDKLISKAKQDKQIMAVFLFGSMACNKNHKASDIDICLLMDKNSYKPAELFKKRMNYLKLFNMDIHVFQQLPVYIRMRIIKESKVLFCSNKDELYETAFRTIREFSDFRHIYLDYLKEVANAG